MKEKKKLKYNIESATKKDIPEIIELIRSVYLTNDPVIKSYKFTEKSNEKLLEVVMSTLHEDTAAGYTLVARNPVPKLSPQIYAVCLCGINTPETKIVRDKKANVDDPRLKHLLRLWHHVAEKPCLFTDFGVTELFEISILATHPVAQNQGIASKLIKDAIDVAKKKGIKLIRIDASSFFTSLMCMKLGMKEVYKVYFNEYVDDRDNRKLRKIEHPHKSFITYALDLRSKSEQPLPYNMNKKDDKLAKTADKYQISDKNSKDLIHAISNMDKHSNQIELAIPTHNRTTFSSTPRVFDTNAGSVNDTRYSMPSKYGDENQSPKTNCSDSNQENGTLSVTGNNSKPSTETNKSTISNFEKINQLVPIAYTCLKSAHIYKPQSNQPWNQHTSHISGIESDSAPYADGETNRKENQIHAYETASPYCNEKEGHGEYLMPTSTHMCTSPSCINRKSESSNKITSPTSSKYDKENNLVPTSTCTKCSHISDTQSTETKLEHLNQQSEKFSGTDRNSAVPNETAHSLSPKLKIENQFVSTVSLCPKCSHKNANQQSSLCVNDSVPCMSTNIIENSKQEQIESSSVEKENHPLQPIKVSEKSASCKHLSSQNQLDIPSISIEKPICFPPSINYSGRCPSCKNYKPVGASEPTTQENSLTVSKQTNYPENTETIEKLDQHVNSHFKTFSAEDKSKESLETSSTQKMSNDGQNLYLIGSRNKSHLPKDAKKIWFLEAEKKVPSIDSIKNQIMKIEEKKHVPSVIEKLPREIESLISNFLSESESTASAEFNDNTEKKFKRNSTHYLPLSNFSSKDSENVENLIDNFYSTNRNVIQKLIAVPEQKYDSGMSSVYRVTTFNVRKNRDGQFEKISLTPEHYTFMDKIANAAHKTLSNTSPGKYIILLEKIMCQKETKDTVSRTTNIKSQADVVNKIGTENIRKKTKLIKPDLKQLNEQLSYDVNAASVLKQIDHEASMTEKSNQNLNDVAADTNLMNQNNEYLNKMDGKNTKDTKFNYSGNNPSSLHTEKNVEPTPLSDWNEQEIVKEVSNKLNNWEEINKEQERILLDMKDVGYDILIPKKKFLKYEHKAAKDLDQTQVNNDHDKYKQENQSKYNPVQNISKSEEFQGNSSKNVLWPIDQTCPIHKKSTIEETSKSISVQSKQYHSPKYDGTSLEQTSQTNSEGSQIKPIKNVLWPINQIKPNWKQSIKSSNDPGKQVAKLEQSETRDQFYYKEAVESKSTHPEHIPHSENNVVQKNEENVADDLKQSEGPHYHHVCNHDHSKNLDTKQEHLNHHSSQSQLVDSTSHYNVHQNKTKCNSPHCIYKTHLANLESQADQSHHNGIHVHEYFKHYEPGKVKHDAKQSDYTKPHLYNLEQSHASYCKHQKLRKVENLSNPNVSQKNLNAKRHLDKHEMSEQKALVSFRETNDTSLENSQTKTNDQSFKQNRNQYDEQSSYQSKRDAVQNILKIIVAQSTKHKSSDSSSQKATQNSWDSSNSRNVDDAENVPKRKLRNHQNNFKPKESKSDQEKYALVSTSGNIEEHQVKHDQGIKIKDQPNLLEMVNKSETSNGRNLEQSKFDQDFKSKLKNFNNIIESTNTRKIIPSVTFLEPEFKYENPELNIEHQSKQITPQNVEKSTNVNKIKPASHLTQHQGKYCQHDFGSTDHTKENKLNDNIKQTKETLNTQETNLLNIEESADKIDSTDNRNKNNVQPGVKSEKHDSNSNLSKHNNLQRSLESNNSEKIKSDANLIPSKINVEHKIESLKQSDLNPKLVNLTVYNKNPDSNLEQSQVKDYKSKHNSKHNILESSSDRKKENLNLKQVHGFQSNAPNIKATQEVVQTNNSDKLKNHTSLEKQEDKNDKHDLNRLKHCLCKRQKQNEQSKIMTSSTTIQSNVENNNKNTEAAKSKVELLNHTLSSDNSAAPNGTSSTNQADKNENNWNPKETNSKNNDNKYEDISKQNINYKLNLFRGTKNVSQGNSSNQSNHASMYRRKQNLIKQKTQNELVPSKPGKIEHPNSVKNGSDIYNNKLKATNDITEWNDIQLKPTNSSTFNTGKTQKVLSNTINSRSRRHEMKNINKLESNQKPSKDNEVQPLKASNDFNERNEKPSNESLHKTDDSKTNSFLNQPEISKMSKSDQNISQVGSKKDVKNSKLRNSRLRVASATLGTSIYSAKEPPTNHKYPKVKSANDMKNKYDNIQDFAHSTMKHSNTKEIKICEIEQCEKSEIETCPESVMDVGIDTKMAHKLDKLKSKSTNDAVITNDIKSKSRYLREPLRPVSPKIGLKYPQRNSPNLSESNNRKTISDDSPSNSSKTAQNIVKRNFITKGESGKIKTIHPYDRAIGITNQPGSEVLSSESSNKKIETNVKSISKLKSQSKTHDVKVKTKDLLDRVYHGPKYTKGIENFSLSFNQTKYDSNSNQIKGPRFSNDVNFSTTFVERNEKNKNWYKFTTSNNNALKTNIKTNDTLKVTPENKEQKKHSQGSGTDNHAQVYKELNVSIIKNKTPEIISKSSTNLRKKPSKYTKLGRKRSETKTIKKININQYENFHYTEMQPKIAHLVEIIMNSVHELNKLTTMQLKVPNTYQKIIKTRWIDESDDKIENHKDDKYKLNLEDILAIKNNEKRNSKNTMPKPAELIIRFAPEIDSKKKDSKNDEE